MNYNNLIKAFLKLDSILIRDIYIKILMKLSNFDNQFISEITFLLKILSRKRIIDPGLDNLLMKSTVFSLNLAREGLLSNNNII